MFRNLTQCPICTEDNSRLISNKVHTIEKGSDNQVELRECPACKHWWNNPMPSQTYLSSLYNKRSSILGEEFVEAYKGVDAIKLVANENGSNCLFDPRDINSIIFQELINKAKFNYLEIGCGKGELLQKFIKKSNLCFGVDPAGSLIGDQRIVPDISDLPKGVKFDIIACYAVLEHLENPVDMMERLRKLVNKGARIYCSFPNKDSWAARIRKERWGMIRPLGHLHYFSKKSISVMFSKFCWRVSNRYTFPRPKPNNILRVRSFLMELLFARDQWFIVGIAQ